MSSGIFYRNVRARDRLEIFLLSAASSLLLVRLYLYLTGYPQISTGSLHIAHMLWGGALMMIALAVALSYVGARAQRAVAVLGGVGFGVFIDELGKFITRDNNYFYQPTIGLIYAIFIVLYLTFNFLARGQTLTSREYQLNALAQLEEAIVHDMDPIEKERVRQLLANADQKDPVTKHLQKLLTSLRTIPPATPTKAKRFLYWLRRKYRHFWLNRNTNLWVRSFFLFEVFVFVAGGVATLFTNIDSILDLLGGSVPFSTELAIGQLLSALVAAGFAVWGAILLPRSRLQAYEQFRRATLVNIFLTQFFIFARLEFAALPGFIFNLLLLGFIGYAMSQHRQIMP
ncbi:MAG TPA: hypothetical protein VJ836_04225 [Candidatus Saccharimonadales bacterium]|nr:hypothetical protein [Candidatus Saccharimonadales bacterium]